jgi:anti-sigma B factor antagonist
MEIGSRRDADGGVRVSVRGEVDLATAGDLEAALHRAADGPGAVRVVADFAAVTFCDSSGLAVLDRAYAAAVARGGDFRLVNPSPDMRLVLEITGLERLTRPA